MTRDCSLAVPVRISHTTIHELEQLNAAFVVTHTPNAERSAAKWFGLVESYQNVGTTPERGRGYLEEVLQFLLTLRSCIGTIETRNDNVVKEVDFKSFMYSSFHTCNTSFRPRRFGLESHVRSARETGALIGASRFLLCVI